MLSGGQTIERFADKILHRFEKTAFQGFTSEMYSQRGPYSRAHVRIQSIKGSGKTRDKHAKTNTGK